MSKEQFNSLSDANKELYQKLTAQHSQREARVKSYLMNNDLKRNYSNEKGDFFHMRDVVNGVPMYISTDNVNAAIATKTNQLQIGGAMGLDLDGTGVVVAIWDGGPVSSTHPEFGDVLGTSRVTLVNFGEQYDGGIAHATHVGGTIAAKGLDPIAKGMAPNVSLTSYDFFNDLVEIITGVTSVSEPVYLSNHSYGFVTANSAVRGAYVQNSRSLDELAYNNPKYLGVHSAGNNGFSNSSGQLFPGLDKLTFYATAKNTLVIANANPNVSGGNLVLVINGSSSQGPTDDLRVKPDIAADGTNLYSTIDGNEYAVFSGTSMAAPNTTGTLALLQQYYKQLNGGVIMNSSTLKAIVCHTAVDDQTKTGPDASFGWGFLDAKASAEVIGGAEDNSALLEELTLNNNSSYSYTFMAEAGNRLGATICWTDVPGALANGELNDPTPALVNDLDLRITKDGTTFLPWRLSRSNIGGLTNSKGDNSVDNVERIDIDVPEAGEYTLTVTHKGSLQGTGNSQDYSLVLTGSNLTLNVEENSLSRSLLVFPNPSNGNITISFDSKSNNDVKVAIFDLRGRAVFKKTYINGAPQFSQTIHLSNVQSGLYIAHISEGENTTSQKFVKY
jgi:hypothetical protein